MLESADIGFILLLIIVSFIAGAICMLVLNWLSERKLRSLEKSINGKAGVVAKAEQNAEDEAELIAAIGEAASLHAEGKTIPEIVKEVGLRHPAVAMKFIKMFLSGKLKLPAGMGNLI